jgi:hypothetical protein
MNLEPGEIFIIDAIDLFSLFLCTFFSLIFNETLGQKASFVEPQFLHL